MPIDVAKLNESFRQLVGAAENATEQVNGLADEVVADAAVEADRAGSEADLAEQRAAQADAAAGAAAAAALAVSGGAYVGPYATKTAFETDGGKGDGDYLIVETGDRWRVTGGVAAFVRNEVNTPVQTFLALASRYGSSGQVLDVLDARRGGGLAWAATWAHAQGLHSWAASLTEAQAKAAGLVSDAANDPNAVWVRLWDRGAARPEWAGDVYQNDKDANAAAFRSAVDALKLTGGRVLRLDHGDFNLESQSGATQAALRFLQMENVEVVGQGWRTAAGTGTALRLHAKTGGYTGDANVVEIDRCKKVAFRHLTLDGFERGQTIPPGNNPHPVTGAARLSEQMHAAIIYDSTDVTFEFVEFLNPHGDGVRMLARDGKTDGYVVDRVVARNCVFRDCGRSGVHVNRGTQNVAVEGCVFENTADQWFSIEPAGLVMPQNLFISNCVARSSRGTTPFAIASDMSNDASTPPAAPWTGNLNERVARGYHPRIRNVFLDNVTVEWPRTANALEVLNCDHVHVRGGRIEGWVEVTGDCDHVRLSGVEVVYKGPRDAVNYPHPPFSTENGLLTVGSKDASKRVRNLQVDGCTFRNRSGTQQVFLALRDCSDVLVGWNRFEGSGLDTFVEYRNAAGPAVAAVLRLLSNRVLDCAKLGRFAGDATHKLRDLEVRGTRASYDVVHPVEGAGFEPLGWDIENSVTWAANPPLFDDTTYPASTPTSKRLLNFAGLALVRRGGDAGGVAVLEGRGLPSANPALDGYMRGAVYIRRDHTSSDPATQLTEPARYVKRVTGIVSGSAGWVAAG